jgi:hypothetical protein
VVRDSVGSAARLWLSRSETDQAFHAGLHGRGFGGCVVGLSAAAEVWPSCRNSARLSRIALSRVSTHAHWRPDNLGWPDFDLTTGPSGTLLSLLAGPAEPEADVSGVIEYLTGLCAEDDLRGLRVQQYQGDKLRAFNHGRVNSGPAHGAPGVALALVAAADAGLLPDTGYDVLRRIGDWLNTQSVVDSSGLRTWLPAGRHPDELVAGAGRTPHRSRRQGWCYGTPGVSWAPPCCGVPRSARPPPSSPCTPTTATWTTCTRTGSACATARPAR